MAPILDRSPVIEKINKNRSRSDKIKALAIAALFLSSALIVMIAVGSPQAGAPNDDDNIPDDQEDELYEEAVEMVRRLNKASVSLLQRRLRIGYTRAARLIDRMEEERIVGPAVEGSKPREVLPLR